MVTIDELKKYIEFLNSTDIEEIEIETPEGEKIFLKREKKETTSLLPNSNVKEGLFSEKQEVLNKEVKEEKPMFEEFVITSPMVGKFLLSVSQDHPPFVMEGTYIKQGQKVAVIETMKILRDVLSPKEGVVKKILVKDGEFVEYGTPLIVLEVKTGE